ncbi:hypothetical protein Patl1_37334 [Pistacia atlantica]|nr:hypothetical protein Patl1_37334 [Pistacia atlantica]
MCSSDKKYLIDFRLVLFLYEPPDSVFFSFKVSATEPFRIGNTEKSVYLSIILHVFSAICHYVIIFPLNGYFTCWFIMNYIFKFLYIIQILMFTEIKYKSIWGGRGIGSSE